MDDANDRAVVAAATDTEAFVAWYIETDDDDDDVSSLRSFMGGGLLGSITSVDSPVLPTVFVPSNHYARRGMSGPVDVARVSEFVDGSGLLEVSGYCWAKSLDETQHYPDVNTPEQQVTPGGSKSAYGNTVPATTRFRQTTLRVWMAHIFRNASDLKATANSLSDAPTQLGRWLLRPAFTQAALNRMSELTENSEFVNYRSEPGPHSVLKTLQRIAARAGLVMHTAFPVIWFDVGVSTAARSVFRREDFSSSTLSRRRPSANYITVTHPPDGGSSVPLAVTRQDSSSIARYGIIAQNLISNAPRRPTIGEDEEHDLSNADIMELLEAQLADAAIRGFAQEDGDIETRWLNGSRYGIDWNLGDTVECYVGGLQSDLLLVNSVAIRLDSGGDWSFRAGLGPTADLAPQIRHRIETSWILGIS